MHRHNISLIAVDLSSIPKMSFSKSISLLRSVMPWESVDSADPRNGVDTQLVREHVRLSIVLIME